MDTCCLNAIVFVDDWLKESERTVWPKDEVQDRLLDLRALLAVEVAL